MLRTHTCGELNSSLAGRQVVVSGWVNASRNLGGLIFIDLRDRYGLVQIKFDPQNDRKLATLAEKLHSEWVIKVSGLVKERPSEMVNAKIASGDIEIVAQDLEVLGKAKTLPFAINEDKNALANEALRLEYRFLDLRRPQLQQMLKTKDEFFTYIRDYFHKRDFVEVQTPILANSSPEGARDFLIPSRLYPGKFYALPQAPQQFKQLLMVGGLDKYFQIAPCFRDEDPRLDRHYGEFYQLDMEMSFVEQEDIFQIMEPLMIELTERFSQKKLSSLGADKRFLKLPWKEAMTKYGTDKPDLRFGLEIKDISDLVKDFGIKFFDEALAKSGVVHALKIDGGAAFSRKQRDEIINLAKAKGLGGLAYIILKEKDVSSSLTKFLSEDQLRSITADCQAGSGDLVLIAAGAWRTVCSALGTVRLDCADRLNLKDNSLAAWAWIVDFPMYDYSEIEEGRIDFGHNPFSMPQGGLKALKEQDPLDILAYQFDLVLNGFEVSSGAIRNHNSEIMYEAFKIAGYSRSVVDHKFGAMIKAFSYGAPPHGGNAPGVDRILMVLNDWNSIRDIYAFPKSAQGRDLMTDSPSAVDPDQLKELGLVLRDSLKK